MAVWQISRSDPQVVLHFISRGFHTIPVLRTHSSRSRDPSFSSGRCGRGTWRAPFHRGQGLETRGLANPGSGTGTTDHPHPNHEIPRILIGREAHETDEPGTVDSPE